MKVAVAAALAGISYGFGPSNITKTQLGMMESYAHYFPKGYSQPPGIESVPEPRANEAVIFEDFFIVGLRMLPHPVLVDILRKFLMQLHHLTPNAIVQISKFIWAVTSCEGHPTADVFTQHYELHYQNKKVHLEGCETTLAAQFGCVIGGNLTLTVRNKWRSGWDSNWFYCKVPCEQLTDVRGMGRYPLRLIMALLNYLSDVSFECGPGDANVAAFTEAVSIIGGHDVVDKFLACGIWLLIEKCDYEVETKETPLSKVVVPMLKVIPVIGAQEL
jgi:hypothetical protein